MDSMIEFAIAIIVFLIGGGTSLYLCFKVESIIPMITALGIGTVLMIPILYTANVDQHKEDAAKELQEKTQINSLSCKGLGSYIIEHSSNSTTNSYDTIESKTYKYAEAKYLVCTHGGLSN